MIKPKLRTSNGESYVELRKYYLNPEGGEKVKVIDQLSIDDAFELYEVLGDELQRSCQ